MTSFKISVGICNVCALPFAVSYEHDLAWGDTSVGIHVGPLVIAFTWKWS
ncbi:hypothetical protein FHS67_002147 [Aminobacter aminovorans]|uniref:Uncharacterized protein n=1 Tax=Aminobacter aminovorans TaxID=83263 RepID=A0AAC9AR87_AMIAI|nr:hypothetical protein AA2016_2261 [Aminobacter aminovorans]MBB3705828.1 hypothetical protein [Aminobacter aminovorans]